MKNTDKTKDIIYHKVLELNEQQRPVTTTELSEILYLKRNLVSHYLNILVAEQVVMKSGTKPVYYQIYNANAIIEKNTKSFHNPFSKMIGYNGSLKSVVENCIAVINYPEKGLPILITGPTGAGKSYLAELIFEYAITQKVVDEKAPFIKLNCADYADNKELLSSILFGHTKNAFTGAEKETDGLIYQANGGYLFLDEVHRLSNEGQEKLFQVLDKGEYRKIGDSGKNKHANVRFIFATSEDPEKYLIKTLRRRIPIITQIPDLNSRPVIEKFDLIKSFYKHESEVFGKVIHIEPQVVNYLLSGYFQGNIGELSNIVISSCAQASNMDKNSPDLFIDVKALKLNIYRSSMNYLEYVKNSIVMNGKKEDVQHLELEEGFADSFYHFYDAIKGHTCDISYLKKEIYGLYDKSNLKEENSINNDLLKDIIDIIIENVSNTYGVSLGMNASIIIFNLITRYNGNVYDNDECVINTLNELRNVHSKIYFLAEVLIHKIEANCGIEINLQTKLLLCIYIIAADMNVGKSYNALIIAHGNSTATSIASVINRMLEGFIFEACDIPFDTTYETFLKITNEYLSKIDKTKPTIILADMGSVVNIYQRLAGDLENELLMINNISTGIALEIGNFIKQKQKPNMIVEWMKNHVQIEYKYVSMQRKKKAIIVVCVSGLGAAEVIKDILVGFTDENVALLTSDYMAIINHGIEYSLFKNYDVQCIVSTTDITQISVDCINIAKVVINDSKDNQLFIKKVLGEKYKNNVDDAKMQIIKTFTLENLVNKLVFLKPEIVIEDVEKIVFDMEISLNTIFESNTKMMLYLHLAVLIERAILKNCEVDCYKDEKWFLQNNQNILLLKESFKSVEQKYNIEIPQPEIIYILDIIYNITQIKSK